MARKAVSKDDRNSQKGYVKAKPKTINKWKEGIELEGTFLRLEESKKYENHLLKMRVDNKVETWACPTVLKSYLEDMPPETDVKIVCLGQIIDTDFGQKAYDFDVFYVPI